MSQESSRYSPPWQSTTRVIVAILLLILLGLLAIRFRSVVMLLILAGILTFLMVPVVRWLHSRARLSWAVATNICFLFLLLLIIIALTASGLVLVQQLQSVYQSVESFFTELPDRIDEVSQQVVEVGPWVIDISQFDLTSSIEQALTYVEPFLGQASDLLTGIAAVVIETFARIFFVLALAYFLTLDNARIRKAWWSINVPGYEYDLDRMRSALSNIWNSFLRGQLIVIVIVAILSWILFSALGVRFSLALGILAGVSKLIPVVGPTLAGTIAALVALFQPSNWFGVTPIAYAIIVGICVLILDQSIDYLVVPRVMGTSLNLHPVLIIVGVIIGAMVAGILGILLSAPATATIILIGRYTYRKLVNLSPWDPPIDEPSEERERSLFRIFRRKT
ncbi:MAG: AI-2E family transporter [Anaerolineales bacterium]|nr:AI-2E family transporter [Anaerolineales bacterium]